MVLESKFALAWHAVKAWYDRNFTLYGLVSTCLIVFKTIPDTLGRTDFWSPKLRWFWWHIAYTHSTISP